MAIFPEEIIIEILTRVPAKSLIRFRCVSKTWCNLIRDSTFIQTHFKHALQENNLDLFISCICKCNTFDEQEQGRKYLSPMYGLDFNSSNEAVEIIENLTKDRADDGAPLYVTLLGSCNGLVCLTTTYPFCVLNPLTREIKFVFHEFDWHYQCCVYGFGYDADADVYSVVHIERDNHRDYNSSIVHVYSLRDTVCVIAFNVPYVFKDDTKSGVYLNGALHWVAFPNSMDKRIATLVSFDMKEKEFQVLPRPDKLCEKTCFTVGLLGGYLSILCLLPTASIEIWIMKNYGVRESWNKLCAIDHTAIPPVHFPGEPIDSQTWINSRLLCFSKNGEIVVQVGSDVVLYDSRQNVARKLEIHGITNQYKLRVENVAHISSLVSFR